MAFKGVRISWLMLARKTLLAALAASACGVCSPPRMARLSHSREDADRAEKFLFISTDRHSWRHLDRLVSLRDSGSHRAGIRPKSGADVGGFIICLNVLPAQSKDKY